MTSNEIRQKYLDFFKSKNHKQIPASKLIPENDPTTLFVSSGMQSLVPYLLGQVHPEGKRLVNSQPSFRAEDIEEVGDNRHTTFFEMLGNWSLGDYFKKEQLNWIWKFLTEELNLPKEKLHVSVFEGDEEVPKDNESLEIWKSLGVSDEHIHFYGAKKNWWSRSGPPENMPEGEIGGPDSEIFYEFTEVKHNEKFGEKCHPNCDCGRFLEIGNCVFIQFQKTDGKLKELSQKNVDFGGGLERLAAAVNNKPDIFKTDLFLGVIGYIEGLVGSSNLYGEKSDPNFRIIADHIKAATFLIRDGVEPSNKLQGYVLRRLLRRAALKLHFLDEDRENIMKRMSELVFPVMDAYENTGYFEEEDEVRIREVIDEEIKRFEKTLDYGLKEIEKIKEIDGKIAFNLYQTFGFPFEVAEEIFREKGQEINHTQFEEEFKKHQELSRTASAGMFKGGLADHSEVVTKYHTATHLLHQALRDVLGPQVFQKGSNITSERLRFDFSFNRKMADEEIKKVEEIINRRIEEDLKVDNLLVPLEEAKEMNAIGLFGEKYSEKVSIYGVGPGFALDPDAKDQRNRGGYYSLEFCGGPHVEQSGVIGGIKITKEEAISAGVRRIRAELSKPL